MARGSNFWIFLVIILLLYVLVPGATNFINGLLGFSNPVVAPPKVGEDTSKDISEGIFLGVLFFCYNWSSYQLLCRIFMAQAEGVKKW